MKLSAAMRIGATKRPQIVGFFFRRTPDGPIGSCALGAAWEGAMGHAPLTLQPSQLLTLWPELEADDDTLLEEIQDMNDGLGYTREQIADILEARGL